MASQGVTVERRCKQCRRRFMVPNQSRRVSCERCSPSRRRARVDELEVPALPVAGEVERSLRKALDAANRTDRYQAVLALRLAKQLDSATSVAGAQGLASQIASLMEQALDGVPPPADFVDEMAERRAAVRGGAG